MEMRRPSLVEQPRMAVGETQAARIGGDLGSAQKVGHPCMYAIARDLGRQRKVEAARMAARDELVGCRQRGFGFSRSHLGFDDVEPRLLHLIERGGLQRSGWSAGRKQ